MVKRFAGLGSRLTPILKLALMTSTAEHLAKQGWILHSGGADGADTAFEQGCDKVKGLKEIFLPWKGFNGSQSVNYDIPEQAFEIAKEIHPAWIYLKQGGQKLHARNVQQVLGKDLNTPVDLVICWTEGGKSIGGTATAINLAIKHDIKVINLGTDEGLANLIEVLKAVG